MNPLVSIVIPTYNREKELKRALESVVKQTYPNWEVLVIDNYSTDQTDCVLDGFNDERIHSFKVHNEGVIAVSRNIGINEAQGKYIAFLDSDDWWSPDKLEIAIGCCEQGYDLIYHSMQIVKDKKFQIYKKHIKAWQLRPPVFFDLIQNGNPIATSSVIVATKLIKEIEGFSEDPELIAAEDYDCWLRLSKRTEKFKSIADVLGFWYGQNNTSSAHLSLIFLNKLKQLYMIPFMKEYNSELPVWWEYAQARALYSIKDDNGTKEILLRLIKRESPFTVRLKALYMLLGYHFRL